MADLDNLPIPSIEDMSNDEAIEYLRQLRLARRIPSKPSKAVTEKRKQKAIPKMSAAQAAELLKLLED